MEIGSADALDTYLRKVAHGALRVAALAPEQVRARRLRATPVQTKGGARRILFLTPRSWAVHVQLESVIAQALRARGASVSFLTCGGGLNICDRCNTYEAPPMPCCSCRRYTQAALAAHGMDFQSLADEWTSDTRAAWPELDELGLPELFEVRGEGLDLGRLIQIPLRWFLLRSALEGDPLAELTARRFLRSARMVARSLRTTLERQRPDTLVVLSGLFLFESIARALGDELNIDTVGYERGHILNSWVFFRRPSAKMYHIDDAWQKWSQTPLSPTEEDALDRYLVDRQFGRRDILLSWKNTVPRPVERSTFRRRALLFTNLTWDSAVLDKERTFASIHHWIRATVEFFRSNPAYELVIRVHPSEVKLPGKLTREPLGLFVREHVNPLPSNIRLIDADDPTSSYSLMETADVGLVYTSTTGLELALRGIPTFVAGDVHYQGKGFTLDLATPTEYLDALRSALDDPARFAPDVQLARRYAFLFFFRVPVVVPGVEEHRVGLTRLTLQTYDELLPGRDADLDRLCDGILHGGDFQP